VYTEENTKVGAFSQDSSDLKCILDVHYLGKPGTIHDPNHIEAKIRPTFTIPPVRHPFPRRTHHLPLLPPVHCPERPAKTLRNPRLHLDERNQTSLGANALDDKIDVTVPGTKPPLENAPPARNQPLLRYPLASPAKLLLRC
jgi:hypothetical protein